MTKSEYMAYHEMACKRMMAITRAKNADYTGRSDDPFANFTRVEALGITDTARGFLVRLTDKLARITSFVQKGVLEVKDESIEDTLLDAANYCILMSGYIKSQKQAALPLQPRMFVDEDPTKLLEPTRMATKAELEEMSHSTRAALARAP
jgi:hypothetical protein